MQVDRISLPMIEVAEKRGEFKPGGMLVERAAGDIDLGLVLVTQQRGCQLVLVAPER